ncbi:hypothetical protein CCP3SC15_170026 [Gammaproteobacteria bacterium]
MDTAQTPANMPRVVLIDLDNCPTQLAHLPQAVAHFTRVVVCYGGFEPKIQLAQLGLLAPALVEGRLAIEPMERKGKNAADFGLTFWAGRLLAEMPPETEFLVLSQDTDLDYLMDMLRRAGRKAERLDGNSYPGFGVAATVQDTSSANTDNALAGNGTPLSLEAAAEDYRAVHITGRRTRPARRLTLINSIRSHFKGSVGIDSEAVLQELIRRGVLSMGRGGQVLYRDRVHSCLIQERPTSTPAPIPVPVPIPAPTVTSKPAATLPVPVSTTSAPNAVGTVETMGVSAQALPARDSTSTTVPLVAIPEPIVEQEKGTTVVTDIPVSTAAVPTVSPTTISFPLVAAVEMVPIIGITGPTDEYFVVHIANQRSRPGRRVTLLNSIRSYFKGQPTVDPEAVMAELFRRGVVSQNRGGLLRYHDRPTPGQSSQPPVEPKAVCPPPELVPIPTTTPEPIPEPVTATETCITTEPCISDEPREPTPDLNIETTKTEATTPEMGTEADTVLAMEEAEVPKEVAKVTTEDAVGAVGTTDATEGKARKPTRTRSTAPKTKPLSTETTPREPRPPRRRTGEARSPRRPRAAVADEPDTKAQDVEKTTLTDS